MFEEDLATLSTADLLESAVERRVVGARADVRVLEVALVYADRFHPDACPVRPGRRSCDGRERAVVLGGDGCPEILEFAVAEFGVVLGISPRVAADVLGQALALRHRFPFTWARVLAGEATAWKACRIVAECVKLSERRRLRRPADRATHRFHHPVPVEQDRPGREDARRCGFGAGRGRREGP